MSTLRIRLLGGFSLEHEGSVLPPLTTRTARSLLALLVTQRDRPHSRDQLAGTFWPDLPEARARRRLSHALWQLQQVLGEVQGSAPFVVVSADGVGFNDDSDFWLDVDEFERLSSGTLTEIERAIELYRGDLLAGSYDEWSLLQQQDLRIQYGSLLRRATDGNKSLGQMDKALAFAKRLVAHNPLDEEAHREVMRLTFLLGDFNDAIRQYEFCVSILEEELGASPAAETSALHEMIRKQRAKGARPFVADPRSPLFHPGEVPMVGRIDERAAVLERMTGAFAGRGGVVLVEGPLGVGISRFLSSLAEDAHWRGLGVLHATARPSARPYELFQAALTEAMSPLRTEQLATMVSPIWLQTAATVLPDLGPRQDRTRLNPEDEADRMAQALTEILLAFGTISPHVVLLDDIQHADPETLAVIRQAARRLHESNVLVILGYHSSEARLSPAVWEALQDVDIQRGVDRLVLNELDTVETAELAQLASSRPVDSSFIEATFIETGGNPLLILEQLRGLAHGEQVGAEPRITDAAADLLHRRLMLVGDKTLQALQGASVFEGPVTAGAIAQVSELSRPDTLTSVEDALRRAFLIETEDGIEFAHAQMRKATRATIPQPVLKRMHAAAAAWLESNRPDHHEELAQHLAAAELPGRAVAAFKGAARSAMELFALRTAADHLKAALEAAQSAGMADSEVLGVLLDLEALLDHLGRRAEQASILDRLERASLQPSDQLEATRRRVLFLGNTNRYHEAGSAAKLALDLCERHGLPTTGVLAAQGLALSWSGHPAEALPHLTRAATEPNLDPGAAAEIRYALGMAKSSLDHPDAHEELSRALNLFREAEQPRRVADVVGLMATNDASRGDVAVAEARFREAFDICRQIGFTLGEGLHLTNLAALHYLEGRPAEALRGFDAALNTLGLIADTRHEAMTLTNIAFVRHRILGDDEIARESADRAFRYYRSVGNARGAAQAIAILASIEARHDPEAALERFTGEFDDPTGYGRWTAAHLRLRQAEVYLAAGRLVEARSLCRDARRHAMTGELSDVLASVEKVSAAISVATGASDQALAAARESVALLGRGVPQPYLHHFGLYLAASDSDERESALASAYEGLHKVLSGFTPSERQRAETAVPEHAAIIEAWEARHPRTRAVILEAVDGGTVEVSLTVSSPDDRSVEGKRQRRVHRTQRILAEASEQGAVVSTSDLATLLGVSVATVRRDLAAIRAESG